MASLGLRAFINRPPRKLFDTITGPADNPLPQSRSYVFAGIGEPCIIVAVKVFEFLRLVRAFGGSLWSRRAKKAVD